jgi:hypothetical protein
MPVPAPTQAQTQTQTQSPTHPPLPAPQPLSGSFSSSGGSFTNPGAAFTAADSARRPSPWHEIAHSLSTTSLRPRSRRSSTPTPSLGSTPPLDPDNAESDAESRALRDWDRLLAAPDSDATRHTLLTGSPNLAPQISGGTPKLAAERDKEGHIEYKLKLIEPSAERFEKLVTQMMWRLKQGKNEAIYELGLADDGTVIGLTRAEMDASLRTLERMASEVGATVIVLKEIVLAPTAQDDYAHSSSSSLGSLSSTSASTWWSRRPDLDEHGKPRKGTRSLGGVLPEVKTKKERLAAAREKAAAQEMMTMMGDFDSNANSTRAADRNAPADRNAAADRNPRQLYTPSPNSSLTASSDDEPTPFHLDMDEKRDLAIAASRAEAKRRKSATRREQRRLDLLRGDGTSPMPYTNGNHSSSPVAEFITHAPNNTAVFGRIPHQPARPSSLRLARTHSGMAATAPAATATPDDTFIDGLSLPLDSLSLSFADVMVDDAPTAACSPEKSTAFAPEETICVEALVVRKPQGDEWGYDGSGWEFGGEDDGWGFGGDE